MSHLSHVMNLYPVKSGNKLLVTPGNTYLWTRESDKLCHDVLRAYGFPEIFNIDNRFFQMDWKDGETFTKVTITKKELVSDSSKG